MPRTKYLIVGSSHAGLAALEGIRSADTEGAITMVNKEACLPYSPTVLPYVFSGMADTKRVFLRDKQFFIDHNVKYLSNAEMVHLDSHSQKAILKDGREIGYEKVLVATGARPHVPHIEGLAHAPYLVLRTLEDAKVLLDSIQDAKSVLILGAGLIGMHAAENLAMAGLEVTVVEKLPHALPLYFDDKASSIIEEVFRDNGIKLIFGSQASCVTFHQKRCCVSLQNDVRLSADILLISTGVKPNIECLFGENCGQKVIVDDYMRTGLDNVWAAGDLVHAKGFFEQSPIYSATLPMAVLQGRVAGAYMSGYNEVDPFSGSLPLNTYTFFGNRAFSVGKSMAGDADNGLELNVEYVPTDRRYKKLVFENNSLVGCIGINSDSDPGVLRRLIEGKVNLSDVKKEFIDDPKRIGRLLMSKLWR